MTGLTQNEINPFAKFEDNNLSFSYRQLTSSPLIKIGHFSGVFFELDVDRVMDLKLKFFVDLRILFKDSVEIHVQAEGRFSPELHSFGDTISPMIAIFIVDNEQIPVKSDAHKLLHSAKIELLRITPTDKLTIMQSYRKNA